MVDSISRHRGTKFMRVASRGPAVAERSRQVLESPIIRCAASVASTHRAVSLRTRPEKLPWDGWNQILESQIAAHNNVVLRKRDNASLRSETKLIAARS